MQITIWVVSGCKNNNADEDSCFSEIHYSLESARKSVAGWLGVESFTGWADAGDAIMQAYDSGHFQSLEIHQHTIDTPTAPLVTDAHGTEYRLLIHDGMVGYRCKAADGYECTVMLNPSTETDDGSSNVFVYHDDCPADQFPLLESPAVYITTSREQSDWSCNHRNAVISDDAEPATYHCPDCSSNVSESEIG